MLPAKFKPLKGERVEDHHLDRLPYPMYASPKLDGIRVVIVDGVALSASLKPIPNLYVQQVVRANAAVLNGYDGELILGAPNDRPYKRTHSAVMRREGTPTFHIHIFDKWDEYESGTNDRFSKFSKELAANPFVYIVPQYMVHSKDELLKLESHFLDHGFEGLMLKAIDKPYKFGKGTIKQAICLKLKRFTDGEARIVGYEEMMHNENEAFVNERGLTERSSHKSGKVPAGVCGKLICSDIETGDEVRLGSGLNADERVYIWNNRDKLIGKIVKYQHFEYGKDQAPRQPVFLGFRDERDMS